MIRAVLIKTRIISAKTIVFLLFAPPWPGELVGQLIK